MPPRGTATPRLRAALDEQRAALGQPPWPGPDGAQAVARACAVAVAAALRAGQQPRTEGLRAAVRYLLGLLAEAVPGRAVEVRVPPYAAVQCLEGPRHTRGTPPNVIETDPVTWVKLATGLLTWADATAARLVRASGPRADLAAFLPVAGGPRPAAGEGEPPAGTDPAGPDPEAGRSGQGAAGH